jgi:hypothetical protein
MTYFGVMGTTLVYRCAHPGCKYQIEGDIMLNLLTFDQSHAHETSHPLNNDVPKITQDRLT